MNLRSIAPALAAALVVAACGGNGEPAPAPTGVAATVGDGIVTVSWNDDPGVQYWLFVSANSGLTTENFNQFPDTRVLRNARSPTSLCGYPNGRTQYFTLNGRIDGGPGGPGSPTLAATPRAAGASWNAGAALAADLAGVGYAPLTTCTATALPSGIFVAVGPNAAIFSSTDGRNFTARSAPAGFAADLNAVAAYTASLNNPSAPNSKIVAVGAGASALVSSDGVTWTVGSAYNAGSPAWRAITVYGATFIAVGDAGAIATTTDGLTWTARTSNTSADLTGIACSSTHCIAVGAGGAYVVSTDAGATWTASTIAGAPALRKIGYGNFNNNEGSTSVAINTFVAVGDGGVIARSTDAGATWTTATVAGAGNFAGIGYTTRFVALDTAGNAFASVDGQSWSALSVTGITGVRALTGTGFGYVAVGAGGVNASAF
ncbi:MAG TPA: hypothetical protein VNK91_04145 [Burkholderiaceae bacterium]|nr:hypothetical protein [Burkholderiaceae bacterium]